MTTPAALDSRGRRLTNRYASRRKIPGQTGPTSPLSFACPTDLHERIFAEVARLSADLGVGKTISGGDLIRAVLYRYFAQPAEKRDLVYAEHHDRQRAASIAEAEAKAKEEIAARFRPAS